MQYYALLEFVKFFRGKLRCEIQTNSTKLQDTELYDMTLPC